MRRVPRRPLSRAAARMHEIGGLPISLRTSASLEVGFLLVAMLLEEARVAEAPLFRPLFRLPFRRSAFLADHPFPAAVGPSVHPPGLALAKPLHIKLPINRHGRLLFISFLF